MQLIRPRRLPTVPNLQSSLAQLIPALACPMIPTAQYSLGQSTYTTGQQRRRQTQRASVENRKGLKL